MLSPCCERCILSFGWFPGVWILCTDVSEHRSCEQEDFLLVHKTYEDVTDCSETSAHKIKTPENHPKEGLQQNLIKHPVKPGLPEGTTGSIEDHHRATFPVLHQCVCASYSYGCIYCALYWSNWILCMSLCILIRLQDKITAYILPINFSETRLRLHIWNNTNQSKFYSRRS
jgi:hypothetical protein